MALQIIFEILAVSGIYVLSSIGYTLIYKISKIVNLSLSEITVWGAILFVYLFLKTKNVFFAFAVTVIICAIIGLLSWKFVFKKLKKVSSISLLIASIAISEIISNLGLLIFKGNDYYLSNSFLNQIIIIFNGRILVGQIIIILISIITVVVLFFILGKTKIGKVFSAICENEVFATTFGINADRAIFIVFSIASIFQAFSGILILLYYKSISASSHYLALKGLICAMLGGLGNEKGAVIGSVLIAFFEIIFGFFISFRYRDVFVFFILILILLLRPQGILKGSEND